MLRLDHHGAEGRAVGIINACVVHRYAEVSGRTVSLYRRVHLFKSASHGFLTLIETEKYLCRRSLLLFEQTAILSMTRQASQYFALMSPLIGEMEYAPTL